MLPMHEMIGKSNIHDDKRHTLAMGSSGANHTAPETSGVRRHLRV
jgi:hypothetical protein